MEIAQTLGIVVALAWLAYLTLDGARRRRAAAAALAQHQATRQVRMARVLTALESGGPGEKPGRSALRQALAARRRAG